MKSNMQLIKLLILLFVATVAFLSAELATAQTQPTFLAPGQNPLENNGSMVDPCAQSPYRQTIPASPAWVREQTPVIQQQQHEQFQRPMFQVQGA